MLALACVLTCGGLLLLVQANPPVPAALESSPSDSSAANVVAGVAAPQEKRLLKYFLPSTHSWGAVQEGAKRGYGKNYLRFGRSDDDKRGGRNFLRFGRGDTTDYDVTESDLASAELEKRSRNFLRFGRGPNNNFLRFGRAGVEEEVGPLGYAPGYAPGLQQEEDVVVQGEGGQEGELPVEEKRGRNKNYLRFGRSNSKNFLRFGRGDNRNFLRFGRSVDRQLPCQDCQEETMGAKDTTSSAASSRAKRGNSNMAGASEHAGEDHQRTKRNVQGPYEYLGPLTWAQTNQPQEGEDIDDSALEDQMIKRGYNKSFLRFGRNRNFLRFGKRNGGDFDSSLSSDEVSEPVLMVRPEDFPRNIRGAQRNFLRFG